MPIGIFIVMNDAGIFQKLFEKTPLIIFRIVFPIRIFKILIFFFKLQGKEMATKI